MENFFHIGNKSRNLPILSPMRLELCFESLFQGMSCCRFASIDFICLFLGLFNLQFHIFLPNFKIHSYLEKSVNKQLKMAHWHVVVPQSNFFKVSHNFIQGISTSTNCILVLSINLFTVCEKLNGFSCRINHGIWSITPLSDVIMYIKAGLILFQLFFASFTKGFGANGYFE